MIYLYILLTRASLQFLKDNERIQEICKQIVLSYRQAFHEEVEFLGGRAVSGKLPNSRNEYVVATCLLLCQDENIDFNAHKDVISYSVETFEDIPIGICTITINDKAAPSHVSSQRTFSGFHRHFSHPSLRKSSGKAKLLTKAKIITLVVLLCLIALIGMILFLFFGLQLYLLLLCLIEIVVIVIIKDTFKASLKMGQTHERKQELCLICGKGTAGTVSTSFLCLGCGYSGVLHRTCVEARRQRPPEANSGRSVPGALTKGSVGVSCPKCGATE